MTDYPTFIAQVSHKVSRIPFACLFCEFKIPLIKYFWVKVLTFPSSLAEPIHVVPAKLSGDMLELTIVSENAEPHIEVRACLIDMPVWAMLPFITSIFFEVLAYLLLVSEVALLSVLAFTMDFVFVARFDFRAIMCMGAIRAMALPMNKLFAHPIRREFIAVVRHWCLCLFISDSIVLTWVEFH